MKPADHARSVLAALATRLRGRPGPRPVRSLVVLGYGAIGDTIFFLPVLEALRRAHPAARLVWVSNPSPIADELIPATGLVDEVWRWEAARGEDPAGRAALNARIAAAGFDLAVLALGAPAHQFTACLGTIPVVAGHLQPWRGLRRFVVFGDYARRILVNRPAAAPAEEHALRRGARLLDALGLPRPDLAVPPRLPVPDAARRRAAELLDGVSSPVVGLHLGPVGNQYGKMWAPERWAELSRRIAAGRAALVLVGSADPAEAEAERRFLAAGGVRARSLVGRTGLLDSFAVLERCALVVANDTGVAKAAGALGVPTATLWGPSDPGEVGIPWEPGRHLDVRTGISCSPCARLSTADKPYSYLNCGHRDCLGRLEADFAWRALAGRYGSLL